MSDLRDLPIHVEETRAAERNRRAARSAFERSAGPSAWHAPFGRASAMVMPVALAAFVGLYMMWAIASASALLR